MIITVDSKAMLLENTSMNQYAQALGRMARGKPKKFTHEQIEAAKIRLAAGRVKRLEQLKGKVQNAIQNH